MNTDTDLLRASIHPSTLVKQYLDDQYPEGTMGLKDQGDYIEFCGNHIAHLLEVKHNELIRLNTDYENINNKQAPYSLHAMEATKVAWEEVRTQIDSAFAA